MNNTEDQPVSRFQHALRLPSRLAAATVVVQVLVTLGYIAYGYLTWPGGDGSSWWQAFSARGVLFTLYDTVGMAVLTGTLVWSQAHHALEKRGAASIAEPISVLQWFVVVYGALAAMQAAAVILYNRQLYASILAWLEPHYFSYVTLQGLAMLLTQLPADAITIIILLVAGRVALATGRSASADATGGVASPPAGSYPVPILCGLYFASSQFLMQRLFSGWYITYQYERAFSVLGMLAGLVLMFALAFAAANLGAGKPLLTKPWRALSATLLTVVMQYGACVGAGVLLVLWQMQQSHFGYDLRDHLTGLIVFIGVMYIATLLLFMSWFTAWLYRGFQPASGEQEDVDGGLTV